MSDRTNLRAGFTLIEMIIAMAILAIIAVLGLRVFGEQQAKARDGRRKAQIEQIHKIAEQYYSDESSYPVGNFNDLKAALASSYLARIADIEDPKNTGEFVYFYEHPTATGGYCICAKLEKTTDGNSGANCDFSAGVTHFCKKNIQ